MKALILNSGAGSRISGLTTGRPKCMVELCTGQTILNRQIGLLERQGIREICITTGPFAETLKRHAYEAASSSSLFFVQNHDYADTNYIYSIYLARELLFDDILLLHGDLVFSEDVLADLLQLRHSAAVISTVAPLSKKDFKAVLTDGLISAVGVDFFSGAVAMQPLYKLNKEDWLIWLHEIESFVARGEKSCYAENALNAVSRHCAIFPFDVKERLCGEIDTLEDLYSINVALTRGNAK